MQAIGRSTVRSLERARRLPDLVQRESVAGPPAIVSYTDLPLLPDYEGSSLSEGRLCCRPPRFG